MQSIDLATVKQLHSIDDVMLFSASLHKSDVTRYFCRDASQTWEIGAGLDLQITSDQEALRIFESISKHLHE